MSVEPDNKIWQDVADYKTLLAIAARKKDIVDPIKNGTFLLSEELQNTNAIQTIPVSLNSPNNTTSTIGLTFADTRLGEQTIDLSNWNNLANPNANTTRITDGWHDPEAVDLLRKRMQRLKYQKDALISFAGENLLLVLPDIDPNIDIRNIKLLISRLLLSPIGGYPAINHHDLPDDVLRIETSKRKVPLAKELGKVQFVRQFNGITSVHAGIDLAEQVFNEEEMALEARIADLPVVNDLLLQRLNNGSQNRAGLILTGPVELRRKLSNFELVSRSRTDTPEARTSFLLGKVRGFNHMRRIMETQEGVEIPRGDFVWPENPLIAQARVLGADAIKSAANEFGHQGVTEFDVATQVMMHISAFPPVDVWLGDEGELSKIVSLLREGKFKQSSEEFAKAISTGSLSLNMDLIESEARRHAKNTADIYSSESELIDGHVVNLPAIEMGSLNNLFGAQKAEVDGNARIYTEEGDMVVNERTTKRKVIFKQIPSAMGLLYSRGFSNLHYGREGDILTVGAFSEGQELPFAYSSYGDISRQYTKDMLLRLGIDHRSIVESTRAWNAPWAPQNTMSLLFMYAHDLLKKKRELDIDDGKADQRLKGVITSINPNLGFKAVAFRGVRFNPIGIKPTGFTYLMDEQGRPNFMPSVRIKETLHISDEALGGHPRVTRSKIPLTPTVEMLSLFDINDEKEVLSKPIYVVTDDDFKKN